MTDTEHSELQTIPQTFMEAVGQLKVIIAKLPEDDQVQVLTVVEYMRALAEGQAIMERLIEASMSNYVLAQNQRDTAIQMLSAWQEQGVGAAMSAASGFIAGEVFEGVSQEAVQTALNRALGFDSGEIDPEALNDLYQALFDVAVGIEEEASETEAD
jgi:hypothetical protein